MNEPLGDRARVAAAARAAGTPCYVYAPTVATGRLAALASALRKRMDDRACVAYAVKANPRLELLEPLARAGASFDVASQGELDRLLALDVAGTRIVFSGPGKRRAEIEAALEAGARLNAEGERDLRLASEFAGRRGIVVDVNVRVNPSARTGRARAADPAGAATGNGTSAAGSIIGGGGPSRFGIDEESLGEVLSRWRSDRHLRIRGVHVFTASNVLSAQELCEHHARAFAIARTVRDTLDVELSMIDLGGGLGIPYAAGEPELDVERLADGLARLVATSAWFGGRVVVEPGRWIAGPAGVYVASVLEVKWSQGERFAVIDGGIHHLLRPALLRADQPCAPLPREDGRLPGGTSVPTTIGGPLCTGLDHLAHRVPLGDLQEGDLLAFVHSGAYGETEAMPEFLLHPRASVAFI